MTDTQWGTPERGFREPTSDECSNNAILTVRFTGETEDSKGMACWYPPMGGYCGKALAFPRGPDGCFDVFVWHDGAFPFHAEQGEPAPSPVEIHHCAAEQFVAFGRDLKRAAAAIFPAKGDGQ